MIANFRLNHSFEIVWKDASLDLMDHVEFSKNSPLH